jgi:Cu(I)/Ag(I) efflux system membrane protein CusA/SilA
MPLQNRLDMALTGIKTPVGMKLQGTNLEQIQQLGVKVQRVLSGLPQVRSVFAERVSQSFYINMEVNCPEAAKYGLTTAATGCGVRNWRHECCRKHRRRRRYPISEVAKISFSRGLAMIRDEDGQLTGYVYMDLNTTDYGGFVDQASTMLRQKLHCLCRLE